MGKTAGPPHPDSPPRDIERDSGRHEASGRRVAGRQDIAPKRSHGSTGGTLEVEPHLITSCTPIMGEISSGQGFAWALKQKMMYE